MKNIYFLSLVGAAFCFISCEEDDHDHGCHECHLELQMADGTVSHSYEIGEFCDDDLADVEANGFVASEAFDHMGETFPAGTYTNVHCEEHADH